VTHNPGLATAYAGRVIELADGHISGDTGSNTGAQVRR
jgi:hypothetical protein